MPNDDLDNYMQQLAESDNKLDKVTAETINILANQGLNICELDKTQSKFGFLRGDVRYCELKISKSKIVYDFINTGLKYELKNATDIIDFNKVLDITTGSYSI